jgi:hypothetical protein
MSDLNKTPQSTEAIVLDPTVSKPFKLVEEPHQASPISTKKKAPVQAESFKPTIQDTTNHDN